MKKFLTTIFVAVMAFGLAGATPPTATPTAPKGVKLTPEQLHTIEAVHPWVVKGITRKSRNPLTSSYRKFGRTKEFAPQKINASGSTVQGWRVCSEWGDYTRGWYELGINGEETKLWEYHYPNWEEEGYYEEPDFPFSSGFVRNGKIYGFHSEMLLYWLLWGHGCFTFDGEILDYQEFGNDFSVTDFSTYVISCAYNPDDDIVYAFTLNEDASAYQLQSINPDTWEFSLVATNVNTEDICTGFAYNPVDKTFYGITSDARFVTLNEEDGTLNVIKKFNLPVTTQMHGMTYSPLDKLFFFVYNDGSYDSTLYTIDPSNPELKERGWLPDAIQYRILVTSDLPIDDKAPQTPQIISISFPEGSLSGKAILKLPAYAFDGTELEGLLKLLAYVDDERYAEAEGLSGEDVEVTFDNISEGKHSFSFTVSAGEFTGVRVSQTVYVGYGQPAIPSNIILEDGKITWDAVTECVDGGYLDADALTYNVYLNDEKINQDPIAKCEYTFIMPDGDYSNFVAKVEAVNHGHNSDYGFSNNILYGHPLPLPFSMAPTEAESLLTTRYSEFSEYSMPYLAWRYVVSEDYYGNSEAYFCCDTFGYEENQNEWLFLPPLDIPSASNAVELSFEFKGRYSDGTESIAVGNGDCATPEAMEIVKSMEFNETPEEWTKLSVWIAPGKENRYIGFLTKPNGNGYQVRVRNIKISLSDRPTTIPTEVGNLKAEALPQGELKAKVSFTMPVLDISGNSLNGELTAIVKSSVDTQTLTGMPGEEVELEITTADGVNEITVYASNTAEGFESTVSVFTGLDVPAPIDLNKITVSHTEDYRGIHIEWEAPLFGANGGYINPDEVSYLLCLYNNDTGSWEIAEDLGSNTIHDYYPNLMEGIRANEFGVLTANAKGHCGTFLNTFGICGIPYSLPIWNSFIDENALYPMVAEHPDDSYDEWGFGYVTDAYPYWVSTPSPYGNFAYCASGTTGMKVRNALPAFSTEGISSAAIEIPLYSSDKSAIVRILAETYGIAPEVIATYNANEVDGFPRKRFDIPEKFLGRKWVELKIEAEFTSEELATVAFAQYKVQTFLANDFALFNAKTPQFMTIGNPYDITAIVENDGTEIVGAPALEMTIKQDGKTLAKLPMALTDDQTSVNVLEQANYSAAWIPTAEAVGEIEISISIVDSDMDMSNNSASSNAWVGSDNKAVVTDLTASISEDDGNVELTWTDPTVESGIEGFENITPFSYGDKIGDFKTIMLDDNEANQEYIFELPYAGEPKAWQVINIPEIEKRIKEAYIENLWFFAATGDQCLLATPPGTVYIGANLMSDRWLITPELKAESTVRFKMSSAVTGYVETVEILVSNTDDNPESFTSIDLLRILSSGWKDYEYVLPDNAKYLAVRYMGNSDDSQFILLDDFEYDPAEESPILVGYDIYRDGSLLSESVVARGSWIDDASSETDVKYYNIIPVVSKSGVVTRGIISNTAYVISTSVNVIEGQQVRIWSEDGAACVSGFEGGRITVSDTQGRIVAKVAKASNAERITLAPGIYMVRAGETAAKLIVR